MLSEILILCSTASSDQLGLDLLCRFETYFFNIDFKANSNVISLESTWGCDSFSCPLWLGMIDHK